MGKQYAIQAVLGTVAFMLLAAVVSHAQIPPPPPPAPPPTQVPIDGGAVVLAVAGAVYGAKRIYDKRKNQPHE